MECLFCKVIRGEIPSRKVYEDDYVLAFYDISPMVEEHILVIPKIHIKSAADIDESNCEYIGKIYKAIAIIAKDLNLKNGFRVVTNSGRHACQTVGHLHFHLLGGEQMAPKMA